MGFRDGQKYLCIILVACSMERLPKPPLLVAPGSISSYVDCHYAATAVKPKPVVAGQPQSATLCALTFTDCLEPGRVETLLNDFLELNPNFLGLRGQPSDWEGDPRTREGLGQRYQRWCRG